MHEYDPKTPRFWDATDLKQSLDKVFDICNGCRLCFNLCGSFPSLFDAAEKHHDDMTQLSKEEVTKVVDECFQCKVCYEKCPYTPDQHHEYQLDFPRLMQRALAQRVAVEGVPLRDRMLGDPDRVAAFSTGLAAPVVNALNEASAHRALLETMIGISAKKKLPPFARRRFSSIYRSKQSKRSKRPPEAAALRSVVYFPTCFVDYNSPHIGEAALAVLEHNRCSVTCASGNCCGMPKWAAGDIDGATAQAAEVVRSVSERAASGQPVIATNPTCSMFIREEYPRLIGTAEANRVAAEARDLGQYLLELSRSKQLQTDFKNPVGKVAYHVPCHLRAQKIGQPAQQLLMKAGAEVEAVRACSGHDGTWSMKAENFDASLQWGGSCFRGMKEAAGGTTHCASDCPLAAIQIEQATGLKVRHPVELLAEAWGLLGNK